ncbi:MAG: lytic transglycosylase domain-containing protein [Yoonia sp.]|uniref:lytic transglycosylase domain-containing protein n=1 Tax=Yoonia sp. TaxID=2212373 RepID=UPI003EF5C272
MNRLQQIAFLIFLTALPVEVSADWQRIQPDFTFKRSPAPAPEAVGRITIQIDPDAAPLPVIGSGPLSNTTDTDADDYIESAAISPKMPTPSGYEWFWANVSSSLDNSTPARVNVALQHMRNPPAGTTVPAPRLQGLQNIASAHGLDILTHTVGTRVSPALVLAIISVESAGKSDAVSSAGAQGLMQLMPATATRFGVDDSFDTAQNIQGGVAYLNWLMERFDNDAVLALAGYNAGEGNVARHDGVPPFAETRAYVPKVLAAWDVAKGLCLTPPQLITDACVFNVSGS